MKNGCPFGASKKATKFFHCWLQDDIVIKCSTLLDISASKQNNEKKITTYTQSLLQSSLKRDT